ncbi:hypothetical protein L7F22_038403 [Adiantum nelumboides]|nr:hypothetical protein [Adiantum nelumboides]
MYGSEIMGSHDMRKLNPLELLIATGMRWVVGKGAKTSTVAAATLHRELGLPPVPAYCAGQRVGKMSIDEALFRARGMNLDLVQLDKQDPPCVKITDYSKLKYELQKRKKEQQKKSLAKRMDLKELKMRYNIDTHDYGVRLKSIQKFLKDGDKVKLIVQFKGRELEFKDLGLKLFDRFQEDIGEEAIVESKQTRELRSIAMVLAPNKGKVSGPVSNTEKSNPDKNDSGDVATVAAVGGEA